MWLTDRTASTKTTSSSHKLVITVRIPESRDPIVRSSELIGQDFRIRTSFSENAPIDEVFVQPVSEQLKECLSDLGTGPELKYFRDLTINAPGLTLAGVSVMISSSEDKTLHVVFRFNYFCGTLNRAFKKNIGLDDGLVEENNRLAALVMSDLALPILNICEAAKAGLSAAESPLSAFGKNLAARADEISFQIELVKRFVNASETTSVATERHEFLTETGKKISSPKTV